MGQIASSSCEVKIDHHHLTRSVDREFHQIRSALLVNTVTFVGMLGTFLLLSFSRTLSRALAPLAEEEDIRGGLWKWLRPAFTQVSSRHPISFDGQVLIRFCVLGFKFCLFGTFIGCILTPIYINGKGGKIDFLRSTPEDLDGWEWKIWLVVAASYALVLVFCMLIQREWSDFTELRRAYFMKKAQELHFSSTETAGPDAQAFYSLMIERVPRQIATDGHLRTCFERIFENDSVHSCRLQRDLHELHNKRMLTEDYSCLCCGSCCPRLKRRYDQGVHHVVRMERELARGIRVVQTALAENRFDMRAPATSTAFVTFNSLLNRQIALHQAALFHTRSNSYSIEDWVLRPAPEARDIVWRNVSIPLPFVRWRSRVFSLLCIVAVIFWSVPVVAITTVTSAAFLEIHVPAIFWLERSYPFLFSLLTGYLPLLAVNVMLLILPYVLEWLTANFEGRKQKSTIARKMLLRNFAFQLTTYFMIAIGNEQSFKYFRLMATHPFCVFAMFGEALPRVSARFVILVLNKIGMTLPFVVLRLQAFFAGCCGLWAELPVYCWFGYEGTNLAIVLVVAHMYSVIAPIVMPLCALYFAVAMCMYRWVFQRVYGRKLDPAQMESEVSCVAQEFDCCGGFWFELFGCAMGGLLVGVVSVTGVLTLRLVRNAEQLKWYGFMPAYAMSALVPVIVYFWWRCNKNFNVLASVMPYEDAVTVSRYTLSDQVVSKFDGDYFLDPLLKTDVSCLRRHNEESEYSSDSGSSNFGSSNFEHASTAFTVSDADSDESMHMCPTVVTDYVQHHHLGRHDFSL